MAENRQKNILCAQIIKDDLTRFLSYMPNPDSIASGSIASYATYREMKDDPRIKSLLNTIKTSALNFPQRLVQTEGVRDEVFAFIKSHEVFSRKLYQKAKRILASLDYGFSITEAVWRFDDKGMRILDNLITRKSDRFVFDYDWNCYWNRGGEKLPLNHKYKWLQYQHDPDDENPYGTSELRCVYWPYLFKKAGFEFWLMATEKFAVKSIVALFDLSGPEDAVKESAQHCRTTRISTVRFRIRLGQYKGLKRNRNKRRCERICRPRGRLRRTNSIRTFRSGGSNQ